MTTPLEKAVDEIVRKQLIEQLPILLREIAPTPETWLTTKDVSELTNLSQSWFEVARSMNSPDQPPYHRVGRSVRYKRSDIEAWMASRPKRGVS